MRCISLSITNYLFCRILLRSMFQFSMISSLLIMMNVLKTSVRVSRVSVTSNRYNKALCHNEYIQTFLTLFKRIKNLIFRNRRKASSNISIVNEVLNNVAQMRRTSRLYLSGQGHHRTQHQDLYINTYLGNNGDIKITQMTVIERSSGTLHTNYYGAVTFRPLGVPKRRLAESAESESGCRIWLPRDKPDEALSTSMWT